MAIGRQKTENSDLPQRIFLTDESTSCPTHLQPDPAISILHQSQLRAEDRLEGIDPRFGALMERAFGLPVVVIEGDDPAIFEQVPAHHRIGQDVRPEVAAIDIDEMEAVPVTFLRDHPGQHFHRQPFEKFDLLPMSPALQVFEKILSRPLRNLRGRRVRQKGIDTANPALRVGEKPVQHHVRTHAIKGPDLQDTDLFVGMEERLPIAWVEIPTPFLQADILLSGLF